ncbi:unnamed protein product [Zymoseptoria tritici ST99CH_3D1]|nr:unnamed protein product [Zymoseptoria tritici ST99CH_3D1]
MARPLHPDDIVSRKDNKAALAVVERTHDGIDTHQPYPGKTEIEPITHDRAISQASFRRFMKDGVPPKDTILVRWQNELSMELLPISQVELLDRSLLIGDIVKRSVSDAVSGVVINTFTKCTLQPMCDVLHSSGHTLKGLLPPGKWEPGNENSFTLPPAGKPAPIVDIPALELRYAESPTEDDMVIYKDWIGRVEGITNNIFVKLSDNGVVEIPDESGQHADGTLGAFSVGDIVKTTKGTLRTGSWVYGRYSPNTPPVGTVVTVRTVTADVAWLQKRYGSNDVQEPPPQLEIPELESSDFQVYDRTRRPGGSSVDPKGRLSTVSNSETDVRLNLRVRFNDLAGARVKYSTASNPNTIPRLERQDHLGYDLNVFDISSFHTDVTVQWQDLSITVEDSINLVPDGDIDDEHAVWPGEIAHTLGLSPVPGMPQVEQPERVGVVHAVNAADRIATIQWQPGSTVYYTKDPDEEEGVPVPMVSHAMSYQLGQKEDISLYDIEAPAALNVRRGDIVLILEYPSDPSTGRPRDVNWLGEIVDTPMDGRLLVRLGAASVVQDVLVKRESTVVAVRSDGTGQLDGWDEDMDDDFDTDSDDDEDEWDSDEDSEEDEEMLATYEDENGDPMDEDEVENDEWESADGDLESDAENDVMHDAPERQETPPISNSDTPLRAGEYGSVPSAEDPSEEAPAAYKILEGRIPDDHRFKFEPTTTTSVHMKRTQKEHKILRNSSSLPAGVYVRSWEARMDLLRLLLIGPTETPYANAPFIVDVYLPPSFPAEPPQVHFHSWPAHSTIGTVGRVNPNLYEDGKICLSLLGTWEGNKGEGWNASRSTLLQVVMSLLGLVLVREPYFNEAGYENLVGTEASKRPSALYSERIFLRAKGFLITALSSWKTAPGLAGLEDIIKWLYHDSKGPKLLAATIQNVEETLEKSQGDGELDGLTVMITISSPIINDLGLLRVELGNSSKTQDYIVTFGTFGHCTSNALPNGHDICTGRHIGYEPAALMSRVDNFGIDSLSGGTSDALTRVMVLHPIVCGITFIAFLVSIGAGVVGSLAGAFTAFVAWVLTIIVMATDFTLFGVVRHHVNEDSSRSKAYFGSAIWMLVAAFLLLGLAMCILLFTCCVSRRQKKKDAEAMKEAKATTPKRKKRFGLF